MASGGGDVADEGGVAVAEDTVVERLLREALLAVDDDAFAVVALVFEYLGVLLDVPFAAAGAPGMGDAEGEAGGQEGEEALVETAAEDAADEVVAVVEVTQAVAVSDEEPAAVELQQAGVFVHGDVHLVFQVVEQPHVVVADEEMQLDARVGQFGHLAHYSPINAWEGEYDSLLDGAVYEELKDLMETGKLFYNDYSFLCQVRQLSSEERAETLEASLILAQKIGKRYAQRSLLHILDKEDQ